MSRILFVTLALCCAIALAGCGGSDPEPAKTPPPTPTANKPGPKTVELPPANGGNTSTAPTPPIELPPPAPVQETPVAAAPPPQAPSQHETLFGEVSGNNVRLRDQPSLENSAILGNLNKGDLVQVLDHSDAYAPWVKVASEQLQKEGWLHSDFLDIPGVEKTPAKENDMAALWARLANITYPSTYVFGGAVALKDGKYENRDNYVFAQLGPDVVEGDLDGDGDKDAVVLISTNTGGSGNFLDIYAMENRKGEYVYGGSTFLGDRVQIKEITIQNNNIFVNMLTHGEEDPQCCPSHPFTATLNLMGPGAAPSSIRELKLNSEGFNGINANTPFNQDAVAKAFDGFDIDPQHFESEGGMQDTFLISQDGRIVAEVFSNGVGGIFSIVFSGGNIVDNKGIRLGSSHKDNPLSKSFACVPGEEEFTGTVICSSPDAPNLKYVYTPVNYNGPDGVLPPEDALQNSTLTHLVWIGETPEYVGGSVPDADQDRVAVEP